MKKNLLNFFFFLVLILCHSAYASHIVGGHIEVSSVDKFPAKFKFLMKLYFNELNTLDDSFEVAKVAVYRRKDNKLIDFFGLYRAKSTPFEYSNEYCSTLNKLKVSEIQFENSYQLKEEDMLDPQGYYITFDRCCRNKDITNITNAGKLGSVFRTDFPAIKRNGKPFLNSSPTFDILSGEYVCKDDPFKFNFDAIDADGDSLTYKLISPFTGASTSAEVDRVSIGIFKDVPWATGYSLNNMIPGNPTLAIDSRKGVVSVTATQLGLFAFAVACEEYRKINGKYEWIGRTTRDFQLRVIDCPPAPNVPNPSVTAIGYGNNPVICFGEKVIFQATKDPTWAYQWELDGDNIPKANSDTLTARKTGTYDLTVSVKNQCARSKSSRQITLKVLSAKVKFAPSKTSFCEGKEIQLDAPLTGPSFKYQWYKNAGTLPDLTSSIKINDGGKYFVSISDNSVNCPSVTDMIIINKYPLPTALITPSKADNKICKGEILNLKATLILKYQYQWLKDNVLISGEIKDYFEAKEKGNYTVSVIDSNNCVSTSSPFLVDTVSKISVSLDSILVCGKPTKTYQLTGKPTGGIFTGVGITNGPSGIFDPQNIGFGEFPITYSYTGTYACQTGQVTKKMYISEPPVYAFVPNEIDIFKGVPFLVKGPNNSQWKYKWSPSNLVSDPQLASPYIKLDNPADFELTMTNQFGCQSKTYLKINVIEKMLVPTIFTPNGDSQNDTWEIFGISAYPEIEVSIFNRWGDTIFKSTGKYQPFDGTFNGQPVPSGDYPFVIYIPSKKYRYEGIVGIQR
jgi:gliding motility-associated-like protein